MTRAWLRHNRSTASPGACVFVDTETRPGKHPDFPDDEFHTLRYGVAEYVRFERGRATRESVCKFVTVAQFWEWLEGKLHKRIPTWMWAHNLPFDLTVLCFWERLERKQFVLTDPEQEQGGNQSEGKGRGWGKGFMLLNDPPTVITGIVPGRGRLIMVDSLNFFVTSLAKMGEACGVPKLKMPDWDAPADEWFVYCQRDVQVLRRCVTGLINWVKAEQLGRFRYTAPAQALSAYRHRFKEFPIEVHDEPDVRSLERSCYYGGRLECYYIGRTAKPGTARKWRRRYSQLALRPKPQGPIYELDVCSLYPYVMRENDYPQKLVDSSFERGTCAGWRDIIAGDCAAVVQLETTQAYPLRDEERGTYYPVGTYWTSLCGPELQRAVDTKVITKCAAWSRYHLAPLFGGFVDFFWSRRHHYEETRDGLYATLCKLIMNSLYGKFGQKSAEWQDVHGLEPPQYWGPWIVCDEAEQTKHVYRCVGGNVQQRLPQGELLHTSPIISAFITSFAREYMRHIRAIAGDENVLYLVTDAVYVTQAGFDNLERAGLIADRQLGKLSLKYSADSCEVRGLHHVTLGKQVKHGSIKATAVRVGRHTFQEQHFQSLNSIINGRAHWNESVDPDTGDTVATKSILPPLPGVLVSTVTKEIRLSYSRGERDHNGWIHPLQLHDERSAHEAITSMGVGVRFSGK